MWRRAIFSVLVGGIAAAIGIGGGGAGGRDRRSSLGALLNFFVLAPLFHRLDLEELYPRIERPLAARHRLSDETHGFWRRIGDRVAAAPRPGGGRHDARAAGAVRPGCCSLDTGLTSGNSFRGEVEAVRGPDLLAAHFPAGANVPDHGRDPGPRRGRARCARRWSATRRGGSRRAGRRVRRACKVDVQLKVDPYSTEAFDEIPSLRAVGQARGRRRACWSAARPPPSYDLRQSATRDN